MTLFRWLDTPLGPLEISLINNRIQAIEFKTEQELKNSSNSDQNPILDLAELQLKEYFASKRKTFSELIPLLQETGTDFQKACWQQLSEIPYGKTISYGQQANLMSNPKAVRAVGAANGKNPYAIVIPCHRVIGANGSLTGYAGGIEKKSWLLEFEQRVT